MTPKNGKEIINLIRRLVGERCNETDLNDIGVSNVTNTSYIFNRTKFNDDISKWDVNNVGYIGNIFRCFPLESNMVQTVKQ